MYLVKTPWLLKKFYPGLLWNMPRDERKIYLTFDDGPIPEVTPFVLDTLSDFNARATFFCIGDNIRKHPEIFEQVKQAGHAIGNHTFNHLRGWATDDTAYIKNLQACQELIGTNLFRPPYGRMKRSQISHVNEIYPEMQIVMWDVLSGDFDTELSPDNCLKNVLKHTSSGSIIVFHDSLKAFERLKYVLPRALGHWSKQGYQFAVL
ncbi:polysaccharide deacetylase family protein [Mucilaginibacter ginkgonis]|uniref:Polysaccharide deacetylase family protein n=1 Tax=Mucilaginibacter ginkgonis TaxID=2682091 RepID=A0A6I4HZY7_9SPHI|nr:polysaccharide deacetylase family protein [Mucilaginibacter ginkgonis]QQL49845.1 polysaccharide deacetylase family protein [Mucilaginibacter ginkgonis]